MSVVSLQFAAFVTAAVCICHLLPARLQNAWLLLVSYAFYALCAWPFVPLLAGLTLATYAIGRRLVRTSRHRRVWVWAGIGLNAAALMLLRHVYHPSPFVGPFIVVGLSFYSLQAMSYLWDLDSGKLSAPHRLADLALYLAYFPKLVAGPFERAPQFFRQLAQPRGVDDAAFGRALTLLAVGLTRKLVIADGLNALLPQQAFAAPAEYGRLALASAIIGYGFVLYNDFAGYTAIARGVSALFGIELSANFAQPFAAASFGEFWNRWHISFSHWLRDYVYLPLSRALLRRDLRRWNVPNLILPPMASMIVCGVWHGASLNMLLWGGVHGGYLVVERTIDLVRGPRRKQPAAVSRVIGVATVFVLQNWALVAFRMDAATALQCWSRLLSGPLGPFPSVQPLGLAIASLWVDWIQSRSGEDAVLARWSPLPRAAALAFVVLLWLMMLRGAAPAPFVYQGF